MKAYWDWSWDELVAHDLPATLKYVNDQSGQKLHYVGHSLVKIFNFICCFWVLFISQIHFYPCELGPNSLLPVNFLEFLLVSWITGLPERHV